MSDVISELSEQLLGAAGDEFLELALDDLGERAANEEARSLLGALHASGEATRLRDALQAGCLARWVNETCTESEERALALQLRRWLGLPGAGAGPDDPARLVTVPPLPDDPHALTEWARLQHVAGELIRPVEEVIPVELSLAAHSSLLEACCPDFAPCSELQVQELRRLRERARAYLVAQVAREGALRSRQRLWSGLPPRGQLRRLGERLRALCPDGAPASLQAQGFVSGRPVTLDVATGVCVGILHDQTSNLTARLWLSGYEQLGIEGQCERCDGPACIHVAALAGRLLDACLDPSDRLRRPLEAFVRVPSWRRFVDALDAGPAAQRQQVPLQFLLRVEGERCSVRVLRGPDAEKLSAPLRLLRSGRVCERDRAVLEALATRCRTLGTSFVQADLGVLRSLVEHPGVRREHDDAAVRVREEVLEVELAERPQGLMPVVTLAGVRVTSPPSAAYVLHEDKARATLTFAALAPPVQRLLAALQHFRGMLPQESYPALAASLGGLRSVARVRLPGVLVGYEQPAPDRLLLRITPLLDVGVDLALCMRVFPLSPLWAPGEGAQCVEGLVDGAQRFSRRDLQRERELAQRVIESLGLRDYPELTRNVFRVQDQQQALEVLSRVARSNEPLDVEWAQPERRLRITQTARKADLHVRLSKRGAWLELEGLLRVGDAEIAIGRLLEAVRDGERFVQVHGNDYVELEQNLYTLLQDAQLGVTTRERELLLALAAAPQWLERFGPAVSANNPETSAWFERLAQRGRAVADDALPLRERLRGYQREGVRWLLELSCWAPGACLADEMGLGKTVQTIALLLQRSAAGPALVIAPTSLLGNWLDELARFAPGLRSSVYRGAEREALLRELGPGSVLIVSYEILLRDRERITALSFATQIIDEAQTIRNARTRRAHAVAAVPAAFRVALTGTPVENRSGDLWSLFALIAPGLLGTWPRFRALFAVPIERYENRARARRLRDLIAPFILRRTKDEVAKELPARTEVVHVVALSASERQLYAASLAHVRKVLGKRREQREYTVHVLAEITRLRLLSCHPRLLLPDSRIESSKLHALQRLLDDVLPRGHRVLVFSQFTRHLALVQEALMRRGIELLYLDGSTPTAARAERIAQFQAGAAQVFLISLKAGGTGLNLTAADYVVHMDPWWNPAAEDQASDRAHRIGQTRPVTIIKLVAQGTIEERVLGLHEHKRRLAADLLSQGGETATLDRAALEALLAE